MNIDWKAPFELAFELGLFLIGSILVLLIVFIALMITFGIVRAFFTALHRVKVGKDSSEGKVKLKSL
jgi:hypothetical protein